MTEIDVVQTDDLPWEPWWPQYPGTTCKSFAADPATGASIRLAYVPAGFRTPSHTRHHHGPTREFVWVLDGDLPYVEYAGPTAAPRPFTFREGMLLDRPPRSIHGMAIEPVSELGSLVLEWTTGPNDFFPVPFDRPHEDAGPFRDPLVTDSREQGWDPHPRVEGWMICWLSTGGDAPLPGYHPVVLVHVPAAASGRDGLVLDGAGSPWAYVLDGAGRATIGTEGRGDPSAVALRRGTWLRWSSPRSLRIDVAERALGVTLLCAGSRLAMPS